MVGGYSALYHTGAVLVSVVSREHKSLYNACVAVLYTAETSEPTALSVLDSPEDAHRLKEAFPDRWPGRDRTTNLNQNSQTTKFRCDTGLCNGEWTSSVHSAMQLYDREAGLMSPVSKNTYTHVPYAGVGSVGRASSLRRRCRWLIDLPAYHYIIQHAICVHQLRLVAHGRAGAPRGSFTNGLKPPA
ncbi:hypothetical protein LZ31DRAFT_222681 [Colletotrichum somersetense]|nr:hypothetical protein LZ31DRAFT_222681 [Colletotrichum somersetense]